MTIRHIRISRHVPIATNTHSEEAILIAFPLQQMLHQRTSMLRYAYIAYLLDFCLTVHHQLGKVIQMNKLDATMIY